MSNYQHDPNCKIYTKLSTVYPGNKQFAGDKAANSRVQADPERIPSTHPDIFGSFPRCNSGNHAVILIENAPIFRIITSIPQDHSGVYHVYKIYKYRIT